MEDRVPVNPGRVLITPEDGSPAYYATMTRADNPTQEGTRLNKASLLKDVTASLFGFDETAVPNDIFGYLGSYSQHWWARKSLTSITMYMEDNQSYSSVYGSYVSFRLDRATIYAADSVTFDETTGKHTLVNPVALSTLSSNGVSNVSGKYVYSPNGGILRGDTDSTTVISEILLLTKVQAASGSNTIAKYSVTTATVLRSTSYVVDTGVTSYVKSTDRNAYPDSGSDGSFSYAYIGIPFDNAVTAPKIATGTYKGTGSYGSGSKNSLTFDFVPKIVFIVAKEKAMFHGYETTLQEWIILVNGMTKCLTKQASNNSGTGTTTISWSGNTVSWYGTWAGAQLNTSGVDYLYVALG